MTLRFWTSKSNVLEGEVCSIRLRLSPNSSHVAQENVHVFHELRESIVAKIRSTVLDTLGSEFEISDLALLEKDSEILLRITANHHRVRSYDSFNRALKLLVANLKGSLEWLLDSHFGYSTVKGQWYPGSSLVRLQLGASNSKGSGLARLQQPLSVLLIGTILGSVLIPVLNDTANRRRLRHEERIKIALMIIEQSHETDRRLYNLMNYLVLFRKDHNDASEPQPSLKKEQYNARKAFNEMYLSYTAQAWWWHWNVKSESSLSAVATAEESTRVGQLATEYSDALEQCNQAVSKLWSPFLKDRFEPRNPQNDVLISQAREDLTKARKRRNEIAIEMARIFASH
jgi:hypothetical protein